MKAARLRPGWTVEMFLSSPGRGYAVTMRAPSKTIYIMRAGVTKGEAEREFARIVQRYIDVAAREARERADKIGPAQLVLVD